MDKSSRIIMVLDEAIEKTWRAEMLVAKLPTNIDVSVYPMKRAKDFLEFSATHDLISQRTDHIFCDAVFFLGQKMCDLVQWYLHWLHCCAELNAIGQVKPVAYVHCMEAIISKKELSTLFSSRQNGASILTNQPEKPIFRRISIVKQKGVTPVKYLVHAAKEGISIRTSLRLAWSKKQSATLRAAYTRHQESRTPIPFRVKPVTYSTDSSTKHGIDPVEVLTTTNRSRICHHAFVTVLANYFTYSRSMSEDRSSRETDPGCSHPKSRFRGKLTTALARSSCLTPKLPKWLAAEVMTRYGSWTKVHLHETASNRPLALSAHIANLRKNSRFLRGQDYGPLCVVCVSRPMQTILECDMHALCERCTDLVVRANLPGCPICASRIQPCNQEERSYTRGRILSLDGGGVKGFLQLEVLRMIELEIGLDLPLNRFFDLIVGTSIGGLIALGIGTKQWSIATCQEKLAQLSAKVFAERSRFAAILAGVTGGWSAKLARAMRVFWFDSIYNGKLLESVLREAYGDSEKLEGANVGSVSVAVTATTGSTPPCAIFTNYDKSTHPQEQAYGWPAKDVASKVSIWEAAQCTSAAPVYFAQKVLFGSTFHDGGMLHNNPSAIACREGSTLWGCPAAQNLLVSVGCGDLRVDCGGTSSLARLWSAFSYKLSPAKEEEIRALWGADERRRYERLDPRLDMADIPLDNLRMMLEALPAARASMVKCKAFTDLIRKVSWRLVAATFYAESITVRKFGTRKVVFLRLASRLGEEVERIWKKWPDVFLRVGDKELHCPQNMGRRGLQISCITADHEIDVTLNSQGNSSSVSGFPLVLASVEHEPSAADAHATVLGKRKRITASLDWRVEL